MTSSHSVDDDCQLNKDPHYESSKLGTIGDSITEQLAADHSVHCPVSETGDIGSKAIPLHQLSQDSDVRQASTYPPSAKQSVEQVVKGSDQPLKGSLDCLQPDSSGIVTIKVETEGCCSNMADIEVESHGEEEQKFVPKPPDENAFPRRNSILRHGSFRRRTQSGSSQYGEYKANDKTGAMSQKMTAANLLDSSRTTAGDQTANNTSLMMCGNDPVGTLSSQSSPDDLARARSQRSTPLERRSSSLGAVVRERDGSKDRTTVAVKPPAGRQDGSTDPHDSSPCNEDKLVRKHSDAKATSKNSSPLSHLPQPKQDNSGVHKMKKPFTHKRYFKFHLFLKPQLVYTHLMCMHIDHKYAHFCIFRLVIVYMYMFYLSASVHEFSSVSVCI